ATYQLVSFTYNVTGSSTTGVVDPAIVTTYTVPTSADAGADQSICGGTSATLEGNTPTTGTGEWSIVSGTGGSFVDPTDPTTTFNGTNGTTYTLRWTISNGGCESFDEVEISFPLLPEEPTTFILYQDEVCQGTADVAYSVENFAGHTYTWSYSGTDYTIVGSGNQIEISFGNNATSGTLSVFTTNDCGNSNSLELDITVNPLPVFTVSGSGSDICDGDLFELTTSFTSINTPYDIEIILDGSSVTGSPFTSSDTPDYVYSDNFVWVGPAANDSHSFTVTVTDSNGCSASSVAPITFDVWKIPETGPQYHIPNTHGQ
ncbi:MAG: hypothetical protein R6U65_03505, partial [Perlabentimonas sp.]